LPRDVTFKDEMHQIVFPASVCSSVRPSVS